MIFYGVLYKDDWYLTLYNVYKNYYTAVIVASILKLFKNGVEIKIYKEPKRHFRGENFGTDLFR